MKFQVYYKEKRYFILMVLMSLMAYSSILLNIGILFTHVFFLLFMTLLVLGNIVGSLLFVGHLRGNAIKVGKEQFSDMYEILESHSKSLGLKKVPDMYILQGNGVLNAFALKFVRRNYVVLYSNILEVADQEGKDAVSFIIGHELGHIKRNHTGFLKSFFLLPARLMPGLGEAYSRACEYTCDNIGYHLCPQGALKGMLVLAVGKKLYTKVNVNELLALKYEPTFARSCAEFFSTHPALVNRIAAIDKLNRENFTSEVNFYVSPRVDISQSEVNQ